MPKQLYITRDINGRQEIEKLVSLNPDKYEWRELHETLEAYRDYCFKTTNDWSEYITQPDQLKTFGEWLTTEL